jgi:hypothetical protein
VPPLQGHGTEDGGYVNASDVEDDLAIAANHAAGSEDSEGEAIDSMTATAGYKSILVQRTLSTQLEHKLEKLQRHNLFDTFLIVKDLVKNLVKKLGLTTYAHSKPYHLEWLNNSGKAKVTRSARIHFFHWFIP